MNSKIDAMTASPGPFSVAGAARVPVKNRVSRWISRLGMTLGLLVTPGLAYAGACYIGSDGSDELVYLSEANDASTARIVGPFGAPDIETLAKDPVTQNLFAADADTLGIVDLDTGGYSSLGTFGTALAANGDLGTNLDLDDIDAMGFDPSTGVLYAVENSGGNGILFQVNTSTGALVPGAMGGGNDYLVVTGGTIDDLAVDAAGMMFVSLADRLATVDLSATGTVANVPLPNLFAPGLIDMEGLAVDINDNLIGLSLIHI